LGRDYDDIELRTPPFVSATMLNDIIYLCAIVAHRTWIGRMRKMKKEIAGYNYGSSDVPASPLSVEELELLKRTVDLTETDIEWLRRAGSVLEDQTAATVAAWREVIAANAHLARYYWSKDGTPDGNYRENVARRFEQWILDVCFRSYDRTWLDYQHEIGCRHTHLKKNAADAANAVPHIPLRYVIAFTAVINSRVKPFLAAKGASAGDVEAMHQAWCKAVLLHVTFWSRPYVAESDW
jgi:Protoglobin